MEKKFRLTDITCVTNGVILHKIEALKDFDDVKTGDFGGYVEKEENLSQTGNCWVYGNAKVGDNVKAKDIELNEEQLKNYNK